MGKYTESEASSIIQERVSITERAWASKRALFEEIYQLYRFWTDTDSEAYAGERSNIFIPIAFSIVETKLPRIVQALLSLDPWFLVEGRNSRDHENAEFMSNTIQFQLEDELNAFYTLVMWWKECLIYGNSYQFVGWEKEVANIEKRVPVGYGNQIIGYDLKPEKETVYDGLTLNHLDLFDCFPAPYGTRINGRRHERMPYFILRSEPNAEYLKALGEQGILDKTKVAEILKRMPGGSGEIDRNRTNRMGKSRMISENTDKHAPRYEMYTMFENDWWVSSIEGEVIRNKANPFGDNKIPIVGAFDTPVPHEHFAIGQIEPIIKLQYYLNDIENLKLDFLMKAINPGALINQESFLDTAAFQNDPDGIHVVKGNPNAAYALIQRPNANAFNATNEQINIERYIDKTLGQSDVSRGQSSRGKDTATEIVSLIEQANYRFDLSVRLLKNESLVPMLDMMASRNQRFWPYEKEIKTYDQDGNPEFLNVPVSNLIGNWRFKIKTNPARGNKMAFSQTLIRFLDVLNADSGRHPELVKEIAKYLELSDVDKYVQNPAEDAVKMVVQAANEGLLANSQQAALILSKVVEILAPPGSPINQAMGKSMGNSPMPADSEDMAAQIGQGAMG
jgi:hypothetical protein